MHPAPGMRPMLARLARELPTGDYSYEPKWDGFRCLAFRDGQDVDLRSRHGRPLARYFPEIVDAIRALSARRLVMDGEILAATRDGVDFSALLARLHPAASRVERLRRETPAFLMAFDLLVLDEEDVCWSPFVERRRTLERMLASPPDGLRITELTTDPAVARLWLEGGSSPGVDGVVAKDPASPYNPGKRTMIKVKLERTADCVVGGMRCFDGEPVVASLLLGLFDADGSLRHVGVSSSLPECARRAFYEELLPLSVPLEAHPWSAGFGLERSPLGRLSGSAGRWNPSMGLDWIPVEPERVCEVAYDRLDERRFRHAARFVRWRPDREAASCTFDQLDLVAGVPDGRR